MIYGPILTWPDIIYKQYLSDLGLGLKLPSLEHMRQDMKYFAAFHNFALHLVKDICCCVPGAGCPAWSSVSPMSRSAPLLSVPRHLQQREICREYTDCSTAARDWCSQTAVRSAAWELQPQLHSTGCSLPSHWLGDMPGHPHWASQVRHINT